MPEETKKTKLITLHAVEFVNNGVREFAKPNTKIEVDADQESVLRAAKAVRDLTDDEKKLEDMAAQLAAQADKNKVSGTGKTGGTTGTGKTGGAKADDVV